MTGDTSTSMSIRTANRMRVRAPRHLILATAAGSLLVPAMASSSPPAGARTVPALAYTLVVDSAQPGSVAVAIRFRGLPPVFRLAMAVHAEYDDRYWRFLDSLRVEDAGRRPAGSVARDDSTLWRVAIPGGAGTIRYRVRLAPPAAGAFQGSWRPFVDATGALVNGPDLLLYLPDFAAARLTVELRIPRSWSVATGLEAAPGSHRFAAANAAELLDAPILLGRLHEWPFREGGVPYVVAYWPSPAAVTFDTTTFLADLRRLTAAATAVFGETPFRRYVFLLREGAAGALEHHNSLTLGVSSARLAQDPRSLLSAIAHELFHSWNLVALRPAGYNELSYLPPRRTAGLWWGEGVTMYYADVLRRRAGLAPPDESRLDHLAHILEQYYAYPANTRISPERASQAFGDSPLENPDAAGNYYLQGELIGFALDAVLRDSTHGRRGLDDLMRALYRRRRGPAGFTEPQLVAQANAVCGCRLDGFFAAHVAGSTPVDVSAIVGPLGYRATVDTVPAVDAAGRPLPDRRISAAQLRGAGPLRLVLLDSASAWARAGLRTGDTVTAVNGIAVATAADFQRVLRTIEVGESLPVEVIRNGSPARLVVSVAGYERPRVRLTPVPDTTAAGRARLAAWLRGR